MAQVGKSVMFQNQRGFLTACTFVFALVFHSGSAMSQDDPRPLEPLVYNHPGLIVDVGVGLWAWPLPMDFDGDGDLDLVVNCPDKPSNGVYFF